jgi:hypothetical protein
LLGIFKTARKTPLDQGEKNIFWPVSFATYDQALAECSGGYSADLLLDSICARHKAFYHGSSDFPEVPWYLTAGLFAALPLAFSFLCKPLHVLDFGGSVGTHYVLATKCYPSIPVAKWAVVGQSHSLLELGRWAPMLFRLPGLPATPSPPCPGTLGNAGCSSYYRR